MLHLSLPSRGAWIEIPRMAIGGFPGACRSPHGERGLKSARRVLWVGGAAGRSPHGERGLKWYLLQQCGQWEESLPSRGAWIEIMPAGTRSTKAARRSPHGERGLKFVCEEIRQACQRVAPLTGSVD